MLRIEYTLRPGKSNLDIPGTSGYHVVMEEDKLTSVAFWGTGKTDLRAARALLEDYLPAKEDIGHVYRPAEVPAGSLRKVISYLEEESVLGPDATTGTDDVIGDLLRERDEFGDDLVLIYLWPASPSKEDIKLADKARAEGILVLDLCAALDELTVFDEDRLAADPPEKPKRKTKAEKEAHEEVELEIAKAADIAKRMESRGQEMVTQVEPPDPWVEVGVPLDAIRKIVREELQRILSDYGFKKPRFHVGDEPWIENPDIANAFEQGVREGQAQKPRHGSLGALVAEEEEIPVTHPKEPLPEDDGRVPFDGPYSDGVDCYMNEDGYYRRSNGKPRRGEIQVKLSVTEVDELTSQGRFK